jgi:hypothetical protein
LGVLPSSLALSIVIGVMVGVVVIGLDNGVTQRYGD